MRAAWAIAVCHDAVDLHAPSDVAISQVEARFDRSSLQCSNDKVRSKLTVTDVQSDVCSIEEVFEFFAVPVQHKFKGPRHWKIGIVAFPRNVIPRTRSNLPVPTGRSVSHLIVIHMEHGRKAGPAVPSD